MARLTGVSFMKPCRPRIAGSIGDSRPRRPAFQLAMVASRVTSLGPRPALRRPVDQRAQQFDFRLHLRQLEMDSLVVEDRIFRTLFGLPVYSMVSAMMNSCALRQAAAPHKRSPWTAPSGR